MVLNLQSNALKFCKKRDTIKIKTYFVAKEQWDESPSAIEEDSSFTVQD